MEVNWLVWCQTDPTKAEPEPGLYFNWFLGNAKTLLLSIHTLANFHQPDQNMSFLTGKRYRRKVSTVKWCCDVQPHR